MKSLNSIDLILMMALGLGLGYAATSNDRESSKEKEKGPSKSKKDRADKHRTYKHVRSRSHSPKNRTYNKHGGREYVYMKREGSSGGYTKYVVSHNTTFAKLKKAIRHERNLADSVHIDILYNGRAREGNSRVYKYSGRKLTYTIDGR